MNQIDNADGRKWARFALVSTLIVSVVANVTHSVLAASEITLMLRVPAAAVWPILSFLAIEIIVRITWERRAAHYLARAFVLGPAIPAVIVSYEHQQALLKLMGENALVSAIGPLAIDGLMIGCTLALLFTRPVPAAPASTDVEPAEEPAPVEAEAIIEPAPPAQIDAPETVPAIERSGTEALRRAVSALQEGADTGQAKEASGLSAPTVRRYAAIVRELKLDPHTPINARERSVRADVVDEIRAWARMESVR